MEELGVVAVNWGLFGMVLSGGMTVVGAFDKNHYWQRLTVYNFYSLESNGET